MAFKDILLHLLTYPDPTPEDLVDQAVTLCAAISERICAVAMPVDIPIRSNRIADALIGLSALAEAEQEKSLANAKALLKRFRAQAAAHGVEADALAPESRLYEIAEELARLARSRDLAVFPLAGARDAAQRATAEETVFQSGRPVLIFQSSSPAAGFRLESVLIAWDGGRSAARAVADAMPILTAAREVRILSVLGDKPSAVAGQAAELARHLAAHDVIAEVDEVPAGGSHVGEVVRRRLITHPSDLMVMGAYGRSRAREFILGGATASILADPPVPVLLSH